MATPTAKQPTMNLRETQWNSRVKRVLNLKGFLPCFLPGFLVDFGLSLAELTEDPTFSTDTLVASFLSTEEAGCVILSGEVGGESRGFAASCPREDAHEDDSRQYDDSYHFLDLAGQAAFVIALRSCLP